MGVRGVLVCSLVLVAGCAGGGRSGGSESGGAFGCAVGEEPVSCALAVWLHGGKSGLTVRERCRRVCEEAGSSGSTGCGFGGTCGPCVTLDLDEVCADCASLPDEHLDEVLCDDDPCTVDRCAGDHCTHEAPEWVGEPCVRTNDFGSCEATRVCDSTVCGAPDGPGCGPAQELTCASRVPGWEAADGVDNDCDGETDEDPGPVFPLTSGARARQVAAAGLPAGGLAVAWTEAFATESILRTRVAALDDPLGGAPVDVDTLEPTGGALSIAALAGGGYAVAWIPDVGGPSRGRVRLFGADGQPVGEPIGYGGVGGPRSAFHDTCAAGDGVAIAWSAWRPDAEGGAEELRFDRLGADGALLGSTVVAQGRGRVAVAPFADGTLAVAWTPEGAGSGPLPVMVRRFSADGEALGDASVVVTGSEGGPPWMPDSLDAVALADGGLLVGWGDGDHLHVVALDAAGQAGSPIELASEVLVGAFVGTGNGAMAVWLRSRVDVRQRGAATEVAEPRELLAVALGADGSPAATPSVLVPDCATCVGPAAAALADGRPAALWVRKDGPPPHGSTFADLRGRLVE